MDELMNSMGFMAPIWVIVVGIMFFRVFAYLLIESIGNPKRKK